MPGRHPAPTLELQPRRSSCTDARSSRHLHSRHRRRRLPRGGRHARGLDQLDRSRRPCHRDRSVLGRHGDRATIEAFRRLCHVRIPRIRTAALPPERANYLRDEWHPADLAESALRPATSTPRVSKWQSGLPPAPLPATQPGRLHSERMLRGVDIIRYITPLREGARCRHWWRPIHGGMADDPDATFEHLYTTLVDR